MFVLDFSGAALHEYIWPSVYSLHHKLSTLVSCLKLMFFVPSMFCGGLRSKICMLALSLSWDKYHCHKWHHKGLISKAPPLKHTFWKDAPAKEIQADSRLGIGKYLVGLRHIKLQNTGEVNLTQRGTLKTVSNYADWRWAEICSCEARWPPDKATHPCP